MKLYSRKQHRYIERKLHFGVGKSTKTACGLVLFSRHAMVSVWSNNDGALITDDIGMVTCKRCLTTRENRLRTLLAIEEANPSIFDRESLCGEKWLLDHALDIKRTDIDAQELKITDGVKTIVLSNNIKPKDSRYVLRNFVKSGSHSTKKNTVDEGILTDDKTTRILH